MEKTPKETYEALRSGAENARGNIISFSSADLLAAFDYLLGDADKQPAPADVPEKIES